MRCDDRLAGALVVSVTTAFDELYFYYHADEDFMVLIPGKECSYKVKDLTIASCGKYDFDFIHQEDRNIFQKKLKMSGPKDFELRILGEKDRWIWSECRIRQIDPGSGKNTYAGKLQNINKRKQRELQLLEENAKDVLTGLRNRTALKEQLSFWLSDKIKGYLFMIDIDNFKVINDTKGHAAGDEMLRRFAEVLLTIFRSTDLVGRIGGDEFVVYMPDTQDMEIAEKRAQEIMEKLTEMSITEGTELSVSIGIAGCPEDGSEYEQLLRKADIAMYNAKTKGKKRYCFYSEDAEK